MDSVRGVEAAIELYKDPEYGKERSQLELLVFLFIQGFGPSIFVSFLDNRPTQSKRNLQNFSFRNGFCLMKDFIQ